MPKVAKVLFKSPALLIFAGIVLANLILTILMIPEPRTLALHFYLFILSFLSSLIGISISPFVVKRINRLVRNKLARHTCIALIGIFLGWSMLSLAATIGGRDIEMIKMEVGGGIIGSLIFLAISIVNQLTEKKTKKVRLISLASVTTLGIILFVVLFFHPLGISLLWLAIGISYLTTGELPSLM
jgi:hypothetical protein